MKTVLLLLNTDEFSFPLIRYLVLEGRRYGWRICVGSMFDPSINRRLRAESFSQELSFISIIDFLQCDHAIRKCDLVIALLQGEMLSNVADRCIVHRKSLISPARLTEQMELKRTQAEASGILMLLECGFAPGLDHITSKKVIDNIQIRNGTILSFKSFSGSLLSQGYIDNPWEFKLTESLTGLLNMGKGKNCHLIKGQLQHISYQNIFTRTEHVDIRGVDNLVAVPEGDSIYYRNIYQLATAHTVIKGKLLRKGFADIWNLIIRLGLTDNSYGVDPGKEKSFYNFLNSFIPYSAYDSLEDRLMKYAGADIEDIDKLKWLGLFDKKEWIPAEYDPTPLTILQYLMDKKFQWQPENKDCIVMQHQFEYLLKGAKHKFTATLLAQGDNQQDSAIAKAVGLTTGTAVKSFLLGNIKSKGLHIPVTKEIYDPMLNELDDLGVTFHLEDKKVEYAEEAGSVINNLQD